MVVLYNLYLIFLPVKFLGGVFIATLFGLALAMITLIGEVIYYKKKGAKINDIKQKVKKNKNSEEPDTKIITFGTTFKPIKPKVSYISVYPRPALHPEKGFDTFLN